VVHIDMVLSEKGDWVKVFDPRDSTIFVTREVPPGIGEQVRIDLIVGTGGPRVILRGKVIARRIKGDNALPRGCSIALGPDEREKINYLNGFVRGGLLNRRERRRLPLRLRVTYGGIAGACETFTRDINEEGVFVVTEQPLPEESELHLLIAFPGVPEAASVTGIVSHTVLVEDEDVPGMGIRFRFGAVDAAAFTRLVDDLEKKFFANALPEECLMSRRGREGRSPRSADRDRANARVARSKRTQPPSRFDPLGAIQSTVHPRHPPTGALSLGLRDRFRIAGGRRGRGTGGLRRPGQPTRGWTRWSGRTSRVHHARGDGPLR
jgi:hypothetical protein